jgi:aquaporin Z
VVLTFLVVLVVLSATSYVASGGFAGLAIGMALTVVHLVGIPLTGTSVNPARSLGTGGHCRRVWLFIVAPMVGGVLAALVHRNVVVQGAAAEPRAAGGVEPTDVRRRRPRRR